MEQESVVKAERTDQETTVHHFADGKKKVYEAIRAGLSWPTSEANGCFVILGEEWTGGGTVYEGQKPKRGKIRLLAEREIQSPFLDDTLSALSDECSLLGCSDVYAEFEEEPELNIEDVLLARELLNRQGLGISLYPAPFHRRFKLGMDIIRLYLNDALLVLPESSLASQQLGILSQSDLLDTPEVKFVAVNGLRFVVAGFHKHRAWSGPQFIPNRKLAMF
jgi:hypothetical protein